MLYLDKMVKIIDIIFWITILLTIAVALWLLHGSPTTENAVISITVFVAASEIMLWEYLYRIENKINIGFIKTKTDVKEKFNNLELKLTNIENKIINK